MAWPTIRFIIKELIYLLLLPLDVIIPKNPRIWVFTVRDNEPWGDNMRSMLERTLDEPYMMPVVLTSFSCPRPDIAALYPRGSVVVAKRYSLQGLWCFLRASVCFVSHSNHVLYSVLIPQFPHVVVNLWHGIPIKAILFSEHRNTHIKRTCLNRQYLHCDYTISSSMVDRLAMSASLMHNPNSVWVTGLPRNDLLFSQTPLPPSLVAEEAQLQNLLAGRRLVLYAPTFRDWENPDNPYLVAEQLDTLCAVLRSQNAVLGIRKHPSDTALVIPDNPDVMDCGAHIYSNPQVLLRSTAVLITDYSSIWVDYLLLDRPIIGACYDYERYQQHRSLLYDFEDIFAGSITRTPEALAGALEKALDGNDGYAAKREASRKLLLQYRDNGSTQRVFERIAALPRLQRKQRS